MNLQTCSMFAINRYLPASNNWFKTQVCDNVADQKLLILYGGLALTVRRIRFYGLCNGLFPFMSFGIHN